MSKRELRKYIKSLKRAHLEEQVMILYEKFKPVKTYYDFVFNPKEEKLLEDAKIKISKEYFPMSSRRPKKRRSTAQKIIKEFLLLGVDSLVVGDIMLYNLEIAISYTEEHYIGQESFYTSMFNAFRQAVEYTSAEGIYSEFEFRFSKILMDVEQQDWINEPAFKHCIEKYKGGV